MPNKTKTDVQLSTSYWILIFRTHNKNHTHVKKVGAHLRIPFWHLLMNLKKQIIIKKLLKWANKKQNNFNIHNVVFC